MGIWDYKCSWCEMSYEKADIKKVEGVGSRNVQSDMLACLNLSKPNYSIRILHNYLCKSCAKKYNETLRRIDEAWNRKEDVELVSASYMGKKRYDQTSQYEIETTWERNWDYARNLLKTLAWYHGYNMVIDVRKKVDTWEETSDSGKGTHYYKVAKYTGIAVIKV